MARAVINRKNAVASVPTTEVRLFPGKRDCVGVVFARKGPAQLALYATLAESEQEAQTLCDSFLTDVLAAGRLDDLIEERYRVWLRLTPAERAQAVNYNASR